MKTKRTPATEQIHTARQFGVRAYLAGHRAASCLDASFLEMLKGRAIGETPPGEAPTIQLLKAWSAGWTAASMADQ